MTSTIGYCTLIVATGVALVVSVYAPTLMSDQNEFLREFVNHEFLNLLGVILAITLASAAQLHLTLNQIEERHRQPGAFRDTRAGVHRAVSWLIGLFLCGVAIVVIKPMTSELQWQQSLFNGAATIIVIWNVLLLISMTRTIFKIEPWIEDDT